MKNRFKNKKPIYLDYAGGTPINLETLKEMSLFQKDFFANPSAIYDSGVKARNVIQLARENIARKLKAHSDEIIFTGSGTESNALAIWGVVNNFRENFKGITPHIIVSQIEHPAVLENCKLIEKRGQAEVTYIKTDKDGLINPKDIRGALKENTVLVSVMYANNEIGTVEPIEEIAREIRHFRKNKNQKEYFPLLHTDACQAMNYLFTENVEKLGVDLLTFNSSKIYGPKGIGVLYKKRSVVLSPIYSGGGQEFGLRSGTESLPLVVGISSALEIVNDIKNRETKRLIKIRDYGIKKLLSLQKETDYRIILNGHIKNRLPNNINISISEISSELMVLELSARGFFVSEKSACKSEEEGLSHVIKTIREESSAEDKTVNNSIRISLGKFTTKKDIDSLYMAIKDILIKYKKWK